MLIPHGSVVLVADGAKMLFFRNAGDAGRIDLKVVEADQQRDAPDGAIKSDAAGRKAGGGTVGEADYHLQAEQRFAAEAAERINRGALSGEYERLIIVASPKTLGELRKHYHKEAQSRIVAEIPKDLAGHPVDRIESALQSYEA